MVADTLRHANRTHASWSTACRNMNISWSILCQQVGCDETESALRSIDCTNTIQCTLILCQNLRAAKALIYRIQWKSLRRVAILRFSCDASNFTATQQNSLWQQVNKSIPNWKTGRNPWILWDKKRQRIKLLFVWRRALILFCSFFHFELIE